jgi:uncharacterized cupredoxin-like copper-binding protein
VTRVRKVALGATLLVAACAPDPTTATPFGVTLTDQAISLGSPEVVAGAIRFDIDNQSAALVHEVEVFAGATAGLVLPVHSSLADTNGLRLVDEIENILPRSSASLTVDLAPGTYLVICNLPDHYNQGMWTYLTVR